MKILKILLFFTLCSCKVAGYNLDEDPINTQVFQQEGDLEGKRIASIDFDLVTGEKLLLEGKVLCNDVEGYERAVFGPDVQTALKGQGIVLAYFKRVLITLVLSVLQEKMLLRKCLTSK